MTRTPVASLSKLLGRMDDMESQDIQKEFIGLFYGSQGTGKTTAAQALAQKLRGDDGEILYLDSADGWVSLAAPKWAALRKATRLLRVDDPRELMVIGKALRSRSKGFEKITVVVIDEISSMFTDVLHAYVREITNTPDNEDLPEIEGSMYAAPQQAFLNVVKEFHKTTGVHLVMVAHEQGRAIKGDRNAEKITPSISPKLMSNIAQLSHVVARFESRKVGDDYTREAQVLPTRYVEAKTRIPDLPVKLPVTSLVKEIAGWVYGDTMEADLAAPEVQPVLEDPDENDDFEVSAEDDASEEG